MVGKFLFCFVANMAESGDGGPTGKQDGVDEVCPKCDKVVKNRDMALLCDLCEFWYHISCEEVTKEAYRFLMRKDVSAIHWYCKRCDITARKILSHVTRLEKRQDDVERKVEKLEKYSHENFEELRSEVEKLKAEVIPGEENFMKLRKDLDEIKTKVCEEVKEEVGRSYRDIVKEEAKKVYDVQAAVISGEEVIAKTTSKIQERLDRKNNLVLYNVPEEVKREMNLGIRSEKIKHDKMILKEVCAEIGVNCYDDDIVSVTRLGKYMGAQDSETTKPRPILVVLNDGVKGKVMRNAHKLKDCKNLVYKNIGLSHDMNEEERRKNNDLRKVAAERNMEAQSKDEENNFLYVVRGLPWERAIVRIRRRTTRGSEAHNEEVGIGSNGTHAAGAEGVDSTV